MGSGGPMQGVILAVDTLREQHHILVFRAEDQPVERQGFVPNVLFPTGIIQQGDSLLTYCGAADTASCVLELGLADLLLSGSSPASFR